MPSLLSNLNLPSRHLKQLVLVNLLAVSSCAQPANLRAQRGALETTSAQPAASDDELRNGLVRFNVSPAQTVEQSSFSMEFLISSSTGCSVV